jgi:hypothetical protein
MGIKILIQKKIMKFGILRWEALYLTGVSEGLGVSAEYTLPQNVTNHLTIRTM